MKQKMYLKMLIFVIIDLIIQHQHPTVIAFINTSIEIHANDILESRFDIVCDENGFVIFIGGTGGVYVQCFYFSKNFPKFTGM